MGRSDWGPNDSLGLEAENGLLWLGRVGIDEAGVVVACARAITMYGLLMA